MTIQKKRPLLAALLVKCELAASGRSVFGEKRANSRRHVGIRSRNVRGTCASPVNCTTGSSGQGVSKRYSSTSCSSTDIRRQNNGVFCSRNASRRVVEGNSNNAPFCDLHTIDELRVSAGIDVLSVPSGHHICKFGGAGAVRSNHILCALSEPNTFRDTRADRVILISRQSHSSQDTNDRHNDHQFDKGKAGLCAAGESAMVH